MDSRRASALIEPGGSGGCGEVGGAEGTEGVLLEQEGRRVVAGGGVAGAERPAAGKRLGREGTVAREGEGHALGQGAEEDPEALESAGQRVGGGGDEASVAEEPELVGVEPVEEGVERVGVEVDG